jgi:glutamate transport system permease protein
VNLIGYMVEHWDLYSEGLVRTLQVANVSFVFALVVGIVIASFRVSPVPPLQRLASVYVSVFRNSPLLIIFFLAFFGLPKLGFTFSPFATTAIVMSLYTGAYLGEAVRSGINSVSTGQAEAARAIGLTFTQVLGQIVIPQALRTVVGPIGNLYIANGKNTAIGLTIGLFELTAVSQRLINRTADVNAFIGAAALYVVWLLLAGYLFGVIERRVAIRR